MKKLVKILCLSLMFGTGLTLSSCNETPVSSDTEPSKVAIYTAYCEFAGNLFMSGKGDLGPLPAETTFYNDYSWEAHATGKAMYSDFEGSWEYNNTLSMKLLIQDGVEKEGEDQKVEIDTTDERVWSWTLSHQDDRGTGMKYHKNHMSRYGFLKAYNEKMNKNETLPAEPTFKLIFDNGIWETKGWFGESRTGDLTGSMQDIVGKSGEEVTLPTCGFTRENYTFTSYTVIDGLKTTKNVGEKYVLRDWDISVRSNFTKNA